MAEKRKLSKEVGKEVKVEYSDGREAEAITLMPPSDIDEGLRVRRIVLDAGKALAKTADNPEKGGQSQDNADDALKRYDETLINSADVVKCCMGPDYDDWTRADVYNKLRVVKGGVFSPLVREAYAILGFSWGIDDADDDARALALEDTGNP